MQTLMTFEVILAKGIRQMRPDSTLICGLGINLVRYIILMETEIQVVG